jgi:serine/threonine protein phosphatase PrpC
MKYSLVADSRIGARGMNQDRVAHWRCGESLLMAVADGLGGHLHGEIAAQLAMDHLGAAFAREARPRLANPSQFLLSAVRGAHQAILRDAKQKGLRDTPRTVIVACVVQDGHACWAHVGDARIYLIRKGRIVVRTRDHSLVQHLLDEGRIREEAIPSHPERNRLLQCLGGFQLPRPDRPASYRLARHDVLLLCSDGFWGPLTQRQLLHGLHQRPLDEAVADLMALAETRAGPECDNVSVVAMAWGEDELDADEAPRTVPQYELPTDVQDFSATDPNFLRLSEEDMEKAIAEIKAALRKNAAS